MALKTLSILKKYFTYKFCLNILLYFPLLTLVSLLAFWIYLSSESISNLISIDEAEKLKFHYIIVGAGTAGCVLANKLSENPNNNVLVIEAGNTFSPLAMVPLLASQQQKTSVDWQLQTTSQKYSSIGFLNQVICLIKQNKLLQHNYIMFAHFLVSLLETRCNFYQEEKA